MPKVTEYVETIGSGIVSLVTVYENLGPEAKTFLQNEIAAIAAEWATVKTALDNFASASDLGKLGALASLGGVFGGLITFVETTFTNGEQFFASDWPVVKAAIEPVLALFGLSVSPAPAAAPAADPAPAPAGA